MSTHFSIVRRIWLGSTLLHSFCIPPVIVTKLSFSPCVFSCATSYTPPAIQLFLDRNWTDLTKGALYNEILDPNFESLGGRGWHKTVVCVATKGLWPC